MPLFWRLQIAGWLVFVLLSLPLRVSFLGSVQRAILVSLYREPVGFLLTLALRFVYRRLRLGSERPVLLGACMVAASMTASGIDYGVGTLLDLPLHAVPSEKLATQGLFWFRSVIYVTWSLMYFLIRQVIAAREKALTLARSEAAAHQAELQFLRAQVDPHFLFNALNTVLAGLDRDPRALAPVVQGLADYLRYSLLNRHAAFVPLGDEFDATMNYLVVEKARFRERLEFEGRLDEAARALPVPVVILQPLVENAVKHGYKSSPLPLRIRVHVTAVPGGGAEMVVANTGRWIEPPVRREPGEASGAGLELVKRRLELLYRGTHRFQIDTDGDEVSVRIRLPEPAPSLVSP